MTKIYSCFLLLTLILFTPNLFGQAPNAYQFIEPNISISYDSNQYKKLNCYTNSAYEKEAYDFESKKDTKHKSTIYIAANHPPLKVISAEKIDSLMNLKLEEIKNKKFGELTVFNYDKKVRHIKDFFCLGMVVHSKKENKYATMIICNHITNNDHTQIDFNIKNYKSLDSAYIKLENFICGFKSYSKKQIADEDSLIKSKYTVTVYPTKDTIYDYFKWRNPTFLGIVTTKEILQHKVIQARISTEVGNEVFEQSLNGKVPIICNDKTKGIITKQGELRIANSFGKNVKIPFTFSYDNN